MTPGGIRSAIASGAGLVVTAAVATSSSMSFSYHAPIDRAVLETTVSLVGALAALLCIGRYRRSRSPTDLATASAMALLALSYPLLAAVPRLISDNAGERFGMWALVCTRVAAAGLLVAAGWKWSMGTSTTRGGVRTSIVLTPLTVTAVALPLLVWRAPRNSGGLSVLTGARPLADPLVAAIQLGAAFLFGLAAVEFSQRSRQSRDAFVGWLSVGCALLAVASVNYAISPSLELAWLHTGDLFRAGAVAAVAIGAVQEIASYWAGMAQLARSQERRALARDLHDGLAQELTYLVSQTQTPDAFMAPATWRRQLQSAAERALADSRRSIRALVSDDPQAFEADVRSVVADAIDRAPNHIDLVTDANLAYAAFSPSDRESVLRIVREATTNAVRHSHATQVVISVSGSAHRTLRVSDNGIGFDPAGVTNGHGGFGLVSMRERADSLGATFDVQSAPGQGTTVELRWP